MFLDPFSVNCTVAVTSKIIPSLSIAITVHTDTSNISLALCREQVWKRKFTFSNLISDLTRQLLSYYGLTLRQKS